MTGVPAQGLSTPVTFCQPQTGGYLITQSFYPCLAGQLSPNIWPPGPTARMGSQPHPLLALTLTPPWGQPSPTSACQLATSPEQ